MTEVAKIDSCSTNDRGSGSERCPLWPSEISDILPTDLL